MQFLSFFIGALVAVFFQKFRVKFQMESIRWQNLARFAKNSKARWRKGEKYIFANVQRQGRVYNCYKKKSTLRMQMVNCQGSLKHKLIIYLL